jgi:hypothetical protein
MDTKHKKGMIVHAWDGSSIKFTPSSNGLYKHELKSEDSVRDMWTMLSTTQ